MVKRNILYGYSQIPTNCKIAIYGSGIIGKGFKALLDKYRSDVKVVCYINTFNSSRIDSLDVYKLEDISGIKDSYDFIIVCSSQWDEIEKALINKKLKFFILSNELVYNSVEISHLGSFRFSENEKKHTIERLKRVLGLFFDEHKTKFELLMNLRLCEDECDIFDFFYEINKRFTIPYLDYIDLKKGNVIIEGGVADGSDSANFYKYSNNPELQIYGFEPFIESFNTGTYSQYLAERKMKVFPWALWNENRDLLFRKNEESSVTSHISAECNLNGGNINSFVKGITIDTFVEDFNIQNINLIKLDIEGAEVEALQGAAKTITKYKPQLAISIYHKKEHLYEIPELLIKLNPKYRFKLGFYSSTFIDTVLYGIPE